MSSAPGSRAAGHAPLDPRRAARATVFALVATALEKGGAMALLVLIARTLGADDFGRYAALMALVAFVQLGAELGQEPVLVRLLAQRGGAEADTLVQGALAMRLVLAAAGGVLLVALGSWALPAIGVRPLIVAAAGMVGASGGVLRAVFRTQHRLERLCLIALTNVAAFALVLALARALDLGLVGAVAAWSAAQLGTSLAALVAAGGVRRLRPHWRGSVAATLARSGWALAANAVLLTITLRVGQLIVLRSAGAVQAGYLAAGSRLAEAFALLPEALMLVLLPVLSSYDVAARDAQRALSVTVVRWLGLLALLVIVSVSVAAPTLIVVLFGAAYGAAAPALRVSIWLALLAATGAVLTNVAIARGLERVLLAVNAVTSAATIVVSLVVVPRYGFVGAAVVSLAASVLSQILLAALPATRADVLACVRPLRGPVLLAIVATIVAGWVPGAPLPRAAAATALFGAGCVAIGAFRRADLTTLGRALQRVRAAAPSARPD